MSTRENNKFALCVKHDIYESNMDAIDDIVERVMDILREEKLTHNEAEYVLAVCGENLRYEARLSKKKTPVVQEPELTVKCEESEVAAKPGVMVLKSDTIRLTGDQPSNSFAHSPDPHERYTQQSDRMCTERE